MNPQDVADALMHFTLPQLAEVRRLLLKEGLEISFGFAEEYILEPADNWPTPGDQP